MTTETFPFRKREGLKNRDTRDIEIGSRPTTSRKRRWMDRRIIDSLPSQMHKNMRKNAKCFLRLVLFRQSTTSSDWFWDCELKKTTSVDPICFVYCNDGLKEKNSNYIVTLSWIDGTRVGTGTIAKLDWSKSIRKKLGKTKREWTEINWKLTWT